MEKITFACFCRRSLRFTSAKNFEFSCPHCSKEYLTHEGIAIPKQKIISKVTQEYSTHAFEITVYETVALAKISLSNSLYSDLLLSLPEFDFDAERNAFRKILEIVFNMRSSLRIQRFITADANHFYQKTRSKGIIVEKGNNNGWFKTVIFDFKGAGFMGVEYMVRIASQKFNDLYVNSQPPIEYGYIGGTFKQNTALCSDNRCPCPQVILGKGEGYFYVEKTPWGSYTGNLTCEQGARLRNLDLKIANADAQHWWSTGKIPLRETPKNYNHQVAPVIQAISAESQRRINQEYIDYKVNVYNAILSSYKEKPTYLFVDIETSGLPGRGVRLSQVDRWPYIVQIAWIEYTEEGKVRNKKNFLIQPTGFNIDREATSIHGITEQYAHANGVNIKEALTEFINCLNRASWIIGHNIEFDHNIIEVELRRNFPETVENLASKNKFCTMLNSVDYCNIYNSQGKKYPSLSELYGKVFNRPLSKAHDALEDIQATADCFWELRSRNVFKPFTSDPKKLEQTL